MRSVGIAIALLCMAGTAFAEVTSYGYDTLGRVIGVGRYQGPMDGYRDDISYDNVDNRSNYWAGDQRFTMNRGDARYSQGSRTKFTMQTDGNLVVYFDGTALWSSGTGGSAAARAVFQSDGNLVLYTATNAVVWSSGSSGNYGALLAVLPDGNVAIIGVSRNILWSTQTGGHA